jgi:hypothetical protein
MIKLAKTDKNKRNYNIIQSVKKKTKQRSQLRIASRDTGNPLHDWLGKTEIAKM